jgi:hypothetical protein
MAGKMGFIEQNDINFKNYSGDFSSIMASYSIKSSHHHIKCKAMHIYLQFNQCNHILTQQMQTYLMQLA